MKSPVSTSIAIATALIVIIGILFPQSPVSMIKMVIVDWAILIGAAALLVAIFNLLGVHWQKIFVAPKKDFYSIFFLLSFLFTLILGFVFGENNSLFKNWTGTIILTSESSLMAILSISLFYACFKLFHRRQSVTGLVFIFSTMVFLITLSGFFSIGSEIPVLSDLIYIIDQLPIAGARGILLGISFGAIMVGLRVLFGLERPFSG
jgi:hypothetical protein